MKRQTPTEHVQLSVKATSSGRKTKEQRMKQALSKQHEMIKKALSNKPVFQTCYNPIVNEEEPISFLAEATRLAVGMKKDQYHEQMTKEQFDDLNDDHDKENNEDILLNDEAEQDKQILSIIGSRSNMKNYIPFTYDDFDELFMMATYKYTMNYQFRWPVISKTVYHIQKFKPYCHISEKLLLFIMIHMLHTGKPQKTIYNDLHLERIVKPPQNRCNNYEQAMMSYTLRKALYRFGEPLYTNLIDLRNKVEPRFRQSFGSIRTKEFNYIIDKLGTTISLVDGRNQNIPKQYKLVNNVKMADTSYYNHKTNGNGVKSEVKVDSDGLAIFVSKAYPASIHDSNLYYLGMNTCSCPNGYYEIGDGGYRGIPRMITPYPRTCSTRSKPTFISNNGIEVNIGFELKNSVINVIVKGAVYGFMKNKCVLDNGKLTGVVTNGKKYGFIDDRIHVDLKVTGIIDTTIPVDEKKPAVMTLRNATISGTIYIGNGKHEIVGIIYDSITGYPVQGDCMKAFNLAVASTRIMVENYFGRVNCLFSVSRNTFPFSLSLYDLVNKTTHALTNYHIRRYPLRNLGFYLFSNTSKSLNIPNYIISKIQVPSSIQKILYDKFNLKCKCIGDIMDSKYREKPGRKQKTPSFQFIVNRETEAESVNLKSAIQYMIDNTVQKEVTDADIFDLIFFYPERKSDEDPNLMRIRSSVEMREKISDSQSIDRSRLEQANERSTQIGDETTYEIDIPNDYSDNNTSATQIDDKNTDLMNMDEKKEDSNTNKTQAGDTAIDVIDLVDYCNESNINGTHINDMNNDVSKKTTREWLFSDFIDCWKEYNKKNLSSLACVLDSSVYTLFEEKLKTKKGTNKELTPTEKRNFKSKILRKNSKCRCIFIPCSHEQVHWNLIVLNLKKKIVIFLDSLEGDRYKPKAFINYLAETFECRTGRMKIETQNDCWSCGYRMLFIIRQVAFKDRGKKSLNLCPFDKVQYESFIAEVDKIWDIYKKARSTLPPQTVPWKGKQVYEVFITLIKEQDGK